VDIVLRIAGGELQSHFGLPACPAGARLSDRVDGPHALPLARFPYLAAPHPGQAR
jgi:hypothetical protein